MRVCVGTHSVIAVNISTTSGTEIKCIYNAGSHAIGCFIQLTNMANGVTYCLALQRFPNSSLSNFPIFQSCNASFEDGRYLLKAYDIEKDGNVTQLPAATEEVILKAFTAATEEILIKTSTAIVAEPSFSSTTKSN